MIRIAKRTTPFLLLDQKGSQCGLIETAHSPCMMEVNGQPIEWEQCPRVEEIRPVDHES
jgi:hypothetical protein